MEKDGQFPAATADGAFALAHSEIAGRRLGILTAWFFVISLLALSCIGVLPFWGKTADISGSWNLILVNYEYHLPRDYTVELTQLSNGERVDSRMYPALQEMFDDMRADGVYPIVASGYRSQQEQQMLLEEKIQQYRDQGYSPKKAREAALLRVAEPGTSEHQLGLAVDINQEGTRSTAAQVYA